MTDTREEILERLLAIGTGLSGVVTAERNVDAVAEDMRPAWIVYDGGEKGSDDDPERRPPKAPRRVTMSPQIVILLGDKAEDIGPLVSLWRAKAVKAVQLDTALAALTLDGMGIRYEGMDTNLEPGRNTEAWLSLDFGFTYHLKFNDL